jgi:hypothetical protein
MDEDSRQIGIRECAAIGQPRGIAVRARCAGWIAAVAAALFTFWPAGELVAQDVEVLLPERECQVKYALLYSFGLLTTWPAETFAPPDTGPFVIGVLGDKPFPEYLTRIADTKKIQSRAIVIRRFRTPEEIRSCQILYVTSGVSADVEQAVVKMLAGRPVLIVSDHAPAGGRPATIQFVIEQGAVKFVLEANDAKARALHVDPRLLKLAKRTSSAPNP